MKSLIILFLLLPSLGLALEANLSSPRETMRTFLTSMKKVKQGGKEAMGQAIQTFHPKAFDKASFKLSAPQVARQLTQTFDRLEFIRYKEIPDRKTGAPWVYRKQYVEVRGERFPVEITITSFEKKWYFSIRTIKSIPNFYASLLKTKKVEGVLELQDWRETFYSSLPLWMQKRFILLPNFQWLGIFLIILIGFIGERVFRFYVASLVAKILEKKGLKYNKEKIQGLTLPLGIIIFSVTWLSCLNFLGLPDGVLSILLRAGYVIVTVGSVWGAMRVVDLLSFYFQTLASRSENKFDDIMVPLLRKASKVFVFSIGLVFIGHSLTLNVTNILAGLGIGGLAFALAAKDTLSNLFGSLTVILDRPFQIGDWVNIGGDIEGVVEEVGFRSTRVRTFYNSLITVPNSLLTNIQIDNYGLRTYRRYSTKIGVEYSTPPKKLEAFCEGIRQIILEHPHTRKDDFHVYFNDMSANALEILLYVFWLVPSWPAELQERHRLLLDIKRLAERMGVNFAFPTQTLHVYQEQSSTLEDLKENHHQQAKELARMTVKDNLTFEGPRSNKKDF